VPAGTVIVSGSTELFAWVIAARSDPGGAGFASAVVVTGMVAAPAGAPRRRAKTSPERTTSERRIRGVWLGLGPRSTEHSKDQGGSLMRREPIRDTDCSAELKKYLERSAPRGTRKKRTKLRAG
jgi:hypothetical protein